MRPSTTDDRVLVVGAGPAGLEAAMSLGRRGYEVVLAEADSDLGGRVTRETRLPGLASWIRVVDYRTGQLDRLASVEVARGSRLTGEEILSYGFDHVALATGASWRADCVGRWHTRPIPLDGVEVLTPDDVMAGLRPRGARVVLFDDDHYYLGGVLAELLVGEGCNVTIVTPEPRVSEWTVNTMEQHRIQRRLLELGVTVLPSHALVGASSRAARVACVYTGDERDLPCDALVLVTARLPEDGLAEELVAAAGPAGPTVRLVGDAYAPGTIAAAVWDGHRYAEELDEPATDGDEPPFLREVVALAEPLRGGAT
jgi:dimethylamine/trimethylamine dehydrogenase